jgi:type IV pilus assembly protein PilO
MQISKKEKTMLVILGLVLIGFLYYQFGYQTLVNMVENKTAQKQDIETKYNKAIDTINAMESQKSKVKILNAKITDEASPLYPTLSQEHIILELDKLIKDSGLQGGITFEKEEVKVVEELKKSANDKGLEESSIQGIADKYKYKYGDENKNKNEVSDTSKDSKDESNNQTSANTESNSNSKSTEVVNSEKSKQSKENTVAQTKVNVDFNGSYESVVKFLKALRNYDKKMPVYTINISTKSLSEVKGSVNMVIYAVPKIDDEISDYLTWTLNNTYGKGQPFAVGSAAGTGIKSTNETSDFMVSAKSINSELPTVIIGRADDTLRSTYVYGDGNNEQQAEIILTQKDDKYYYKYKTLTSKMPEDYNGLGNEFVPSGENISIDVLSEGRVNSDDKSGVKLKVVNNTNKLVNVNISGEDVSDPRVSIEGESTNISVNKK